MVCLSARGACGALVLAREWRAKEWAELGPWGGERAGF